MSFLRPFHAASHGGRAADDGGALRRPSGGVTGTPGRLAGEILRVAPDDEEYLRLAALEAAHWATPHPFSLEAQELKQGFDDTIDRYTNARFTGDPDLPWERTICRHGRFRRGLILGTSMMSVEARILESNPDLHVVFIDLSEGALERRRTLLGPRFPGRVATRAADLNFLDIEPKTYDCIVSQASLHHVTNLEYLAHQINRGLTPEGSFFLQDYVGEPRFQFREEKKRVFAEIYLREAMRYRGRAHALRWNDPSDLSPFCGVRSDEVLGVLGSHLQETWLRTAGTLTVPLLRSRPVDGEWPYPRTALQRARDAAEVWVYALRRQPVPGKARVSAEFLERLMVVGDVLTDAGVLVPGNAFAVYRAR